MKKHLLMASLFLGLSSLAVSAQVAPANSGSADQQQNSVSTPGTPPTFPTDQQASDQTAKPHDTDADRPMDQTQQTPSATTPDAVGTPQDSQSTTGANPSQSTTPSPDASSSPDMSGKQSSTSAAGTEVQSQIQSALQQQGLSGVSASVTDQSIDLSGTVSSKKEKQSARSIANTYANGRKVNDNITVSKGNK